MIKKIAIAFLAVQLSAAQVFSEPSQKIQLKVYSADSKLLVSKSSKYPLETSLDQVLVEELKKAKEAGSIQDYEYAGGRILSINGASSKNVEVSKDELHAYGWCLNLDGKPSTEPSQQVKAKKLRSLVVYYCYVARINGTWATAPSAPPK